ncbi:MAG: GNAT family N-acetyltransferase [Hyphomicrobium sp.]|uniref:GNAT family N-acetyltransferase n=1 Tax=Hyphomicrobium sp. TaxID=82 RepID=UPI003D13E744
MKQPLPVTVPIMDDIEIASGADAIAALRPLWHDVTVAARGAGAFERFELVAAAARLAERRGDEPFVAVIRDKGRPVTLLALRRERLFGARVAVPIAYPLAQYTDVVGEALTAHGLDRLCRRLARNGTDIVLIRRVREDGGLHGALSQRARSQRAHDTACYIDLASFGTFADYEGSFSARTRRNRRQRQQRFEANAGPLEFEMLRGNDAVLALDAALTWKRKWLAERGVSSPVFDLGGWERLLREAVAASGAVVSALKAGDRLAAVEAGFIENTTYISYLGAFDPEFSSFSPGQLQMMGTIAWCFDHGFTRYDLLAPSDDYKRHWARKDTGVKVDDYALALTHVGRGIAEVRRHVRPLARDLYLKLSPEMRVAGGRYGVPAAAVAAAAAAASVVIAVIE